MYLNIGENNVIYVKDIIGIFNIEKIKDINKFLEKDISKFYKKDKNVLYNYKSIILTKREEKVYTYISNFSSVTLQKRIKNINI